MNDTEILEGAPLKLRFNGEQYNVRPLNLGKSRVWRKALIEQDIERLKALNSVPDENERWGKAVTETNPEFIVDRVVTYCEAASYPNGDKAVNREVIESGSLSETVAAFEKIIATEFPTTAVTAGQRALVALMSK